MAGRQAARTVLLWLLTGVPAFAADAPAPAPVPVLAAVDLRVAVHVGYTRLVLAYDHWVGVTTHRDGATMTLSFADPAPISPPAGFGTGSLHNLRGATIEAGKLVLTLAPGVTVRSLAVGSRRVVDLVDPSGAGPAAPAPARAPLAAIAAAFVAVPAPPPALPAVDPAIVAVATPAQPVARPLEPAPERPARAPLAAGDTAGDALVLAFAPSTGAAAFRRGNQAVIVFDEPRAIDLASVRAHPAAATATVQMLPQAVVLRLDLPPASGLALSHDGTDWTIAFQPPAHPADSAIMPHAQGGLLDLAVPAAGHVIAIQDQTTGDDLLVGTTIGGSYTPTARRFAEFALLPTVLGVVLDPLSDRVALRTVPDGYRVESGMPAVPLAIVASSAAPDVSAEAAGLSRYFDFASDGPTQLLRRLHADIADAAAAPVLGRLAYRVKVAQTMVALGMGAEAYAVLQLAASDDPRGLADGQARTLSAAAALLAGRLDETDGLAAPEPLSDECRLWRGLRDAARLPDSATPTAEGAASIKAGLPLLLGYPDTLARALLPLAADTLLRAGDLATADALLARRPADRRLDLARAVAEQLHGRHEAALAAYDALARSMDRSVSTRAALAALDLRVADRRLAPAAAAALGDRLIYAWRGDARERDARLRVAAWQKAAGHARQQMQTLREALDVFPDPADGIHARLADAFADVLKAEGGAGADALSPLDLVALVQENADLLPDGIAGEAMAGKLADRLTALDLPQRAATVLERLVHDAAAPAAKAALAARLAALDLEEGAAAQALEVLTRSAAPDLSQPLTEQRALLAARAQAATGDRPAALATLSPLADAPALLARAAVQEDAHDWPAAEAALGAYAQTVLPRSGALDVAQSGIVLRLASATAQAGDEAGLTRLRTRYATRLHTTDDAALLAVLTQQPVKTVSDLPRATREAEALRRLPQTLATQ